VEFLGRRLPELLSGVRARLAAYVSASAADLLLVPNATAGIGMVVRSLELRPGDEILTTDHEYGAIDILWDFVCRKTGARVVRRAVRPGPGFVDELWAGVTSRTRVVSLSHVTSPTALVFPVAEVCGRVREAGILSIVDGAHGPGQVPVDLAAIGADVYAGNCHKWLCAPKGAGFVVVAPELQPNVEPLVVSWGWRDQDAFAERHRWRGTEDPAAWLAVPAAIDFQAEHAWDDVRARCHALAERARVAVAERTGVPPLAPDERWLGQMVATPLPPLDHEDVQRRLREEHRIEASIFSWNGTPLLRLSFQSYNDEADLERVLAALAGMSISA
jgi:isopenicillin-N epimerase